MVKKLILLIALVALILGIFALLENRGFHGIYEPWEIGAEENGGEMILHAPSRFLSGQLLTLTLESNPTTGYSWQLREFDEAVLRLVCSKYVPYEHAPGMVGVGGEEIWFFQAQAPGNTTLHLEYVRPWEKDVEPARTFTVQLTVRPLSATLRFWEKRQEPPVKVIEYWRSGGFAGVDEGWLIYSDGLVVGCGQASHLKGKVEAQKVADLLELAEQEGFFSFEERYGPLSACCDRFSYRIVVFAEGKGKVVMAMDGADAPEGLWRIMGEINDIIWEATRD